MPTLKLDLHFGLIKGPTGQRQPTAQIYVKSGTGSAFPGVEKFFLTTSCINEGEVEYQIRELERELKEIRSKAKRKFAKAKAAA